MKKIPVIFFQRRPRKNVNYSIENIFNDVRNRLKNKIEANIKLCGKYNDGVFTKIFNVIEAAFRQGKHVNHITGEVHFLNLFMNKRRTILTIHDCGFMNKKKGVAKYLVKLIYLKLPIKMAKFITTVSECTKTEIVMHTGCPPERIYVIPVPICSLYQPTFKNFNEEKPTILHIGLGPNKNFFRLVEALSGINCHLSVIGILSNEHIAHLKNCGVEYSNDADLSPEEMVEKYKQCDIVAFVSTFEGFGMPVIEANSVERVVITGNLSSMPEIAGKAACLVNPYDVSDIRNGILKVIRDREYRNRLISEGRKNKLRFDAQKIADSYYNLYQKIVLSNGLYNTAEKNLQQHEFNFCGSSITG